MFLPENNLLNQDLQFGLIQTHNIRKKGGKKPKFTCKTKWRRAHQLLL